MTWGAVNDFLEDLTRIVDWRGVKPTFHRNAATGKGEEIWKLPVSYASRLLYIQVISQPGIGHEKFVSGFGAFAHQVLKGSIGV